MHSPHKEVVGETDAEHFLSEVEMRIGLLSVDSSYPNLALMKIARYHKAKGDDVFWYAGFELYDKVYAAKVFSFTPDHSEVIFSDDVMRGGTGYDYTITLPEEIDRLQPDYSIYPNIDNKTAYGFLTRGCPNKCKWCIVPKKEGAIRPYMDIDEIMIEGRKNAVLMDNNILASPYGIEQIEKIIAKGYKVDFNQALDARLVTPEIAKLLAKVKWMKRIRFGCDTTKQIEDCERAIEMIDGYGYKGEYFLYCILIEYDESLARLNHWKHKGVHRYIPHAQPYRDFNNPHQVIPMWQKDMARWCDRKELYQSIEFYDYSPRKGFICKQYEQ